MFEELMRVTKKKNKQTTSNHNLAAFSVKHLMPHTTNRFPRLPRQVNKFKPTNVSLCSLAQLYLGLLIAHSVVINAP
jgi:hypothetical protein